MRRFLMTLSLLGLVAAYEGPAMADSIELSCPKCVAGGTSLVSPGGGTISFSFIDVANQTFSGNGYIDILVPTGSGAPTLTLNGVPLTATSFVFNSGNLGSLLGQNLTGYTLSNFQSASAQGGINATGYTVYQFSLGNVSLGPNGSGINGLAANAAMGSVIVGVLDPPSTTYETPLSESITQAPEPASLTLLAAGSMLLLVYFGIRKRRSRYA
jgi:hypothetical protein